MFKFYSMKYFVILFLLSFGSLALHAQDTILKRNGERMIVKLTEINTTEAKYKRLDYLEGPVFVIPLQEISFLMYANGTKESYENFTPTVAKPTFVPQDLTILPSGKYYYYKERKITERDMLAVTKNYNDDKINLMIKTVERDRFIQNITTDASVLCGVSGLYLFVKNQPKRGRRGGGGPPTQSTAQVQGQKNGEYLMLTALACEMASIYFVFDRKKNAHILVGAYNRLITIH